MHSVFIRVSFLLSPFPPPFFFLLSLLSIFLSSPLRFCHFSIDDAFLPKFSLSLDSFVGPSLRSNPDRMVPSFPGFFFLFPITSVILFWLSSSRCAECLFLSVESLFACVWSAFVAVSSHHWFLLLFLLQSFSVFDHCDVADDSIHSFSVLCIPAWTSLTFRETRF